MDPTLDRPLTLRERAAVLARIHALIEFWDISTDELMAPAPDTAPEPSPANGPAPAVKYRHPHSGETWDGRGAHPEWLRRALLQEGLRVDDLRPSTLPEHSLQVPDASNDR